ncbi:MAG: dihydrofolate reductase [Candidatus Omnitrophica bacterium]|nr:dihydrofolate reductase [Candidatus Omnitrophota bacterium]
MRTEENKKTALYHVVAAAKNGVIGKDNKLPWHFSADLKYFKQLTLASTVMMGRKTFESIGRPLPGRTNFVISRTVREQANPSVMPAGTELVFFDSIDKAGQAVQTPKAFIIGGAAIYEQTLDKIDGIYLTEIHAEYEGDAFYPGVPQGFLEKSRQVLQEADPRIEAVFYEKQD